MSTFNHTILQVIPALDRGGAERTTVEVSAAIVEAGGRSLVATSGGQFAAEIQRDGGEIIELPVHSKNPASIWVNASRLEKVIAQERVDLIHARSRAPAWSAMLASKKTKIPFVTTYHGAFSAGTRIKRFYNSAMLRSDIVIANSNFTAEAIRANSDIEPPEIRINPPGADLKLFNINRLTPQRIEKLVSVWGLPAAAQDGFKLLLPARLTGWKGHDIAIDAIARLKNDSANKDGTTGNSRNFTLVFCGGAQGRDDLDRALRAKAKSCGVSEMVHFVGDCADMPAAYGWADAVLSPSTRPEAFGRVAVEAGAMTTPIIAARHGGALETVIDGETGLLVTPGDAAALADAIDRISAMSVEARAVMGENARARATTLYSAAAMCEGTLRAYRDLLG